MTRSSMRVMGFGLALALLAPTLARADGGTVVTDDGALARTIAAAIARGEREVKIPKATYRLKGNAGSFFEWKAVRDFTVDFSGSHLIALRPHRMFSLVGCTNVTVKNVSFDYDPLPFVQAVIEKVEPNGDWDLKVIDGYPDPADCGDTWPMQVFDPVNFEMKNPMRCWDGFRLVKTAPMRYRVSGGRDKRGATGDICVWSTKHGSVNLGDPQSFTVLLRRCTRCRMEGVTAYSAPNLFCFNEVRGEGNQFVRCTLDRCPPERDYAKRGLKRLRSGNHDGFNSRLAKRAALLDGCMIRYQCDDCVNVSGHFAYVADVNGAEVRVLDKVTAWGFGAPIEAGDVLQVMTAEGRVRSPVKVTAVRHAGAPRPDELAFMKTLGLWPGQEAAFKDAYVLTVEGPNPIEKTDVVVSENARGNGFVIRNCTFGPNRALGLRIRGGEGVIESNTVSRVEGAALMMGPEYEWFEGGVFDRVTVRGNLFGGCGGSFNVGGTAAHHRPLPPKAHPSSAFVDNLITGCGNVIRIAGCEEGDVRGNVDLKKPAFRGAMLSHVKIVEDDFRTLRDWGANLVRYQMTEDFFRHGEMAGGDAAYDRWLEGQLDRLARDILPWARKYGLKVVVDLHVPPGGRVAGSSMDWAVYYDRALAERLIGWWRKIARRFKGNDDVIYGYDILNEPVQTKPATAFDWWDLQHQAAKAIREADAKTPVIVESLDWDSPEAFAEMKPMTDVGPVIYQAHMYRPQAFTHQGTGSIKVGGAKWPDLSKGWNREYVRERLAAVRAFERRTGAKIYIGEFSAAIWTEGAEKYIGDCISVFAEYGWDWTYHAFREWGGWSVEHEGEDPAHVRPSKDNPRMRVLKDGLKR